MNHRPRRAVLSGCMVGFLLTQFASTPCHADLASFCTAAPPTGTGTEDLQALYKAQCPAYLQGQFSSAATGIISSAATTQLTQEQTQASINASVAGLIKPPASPIASGGDISALAMAAQLKDAQITFNVAKQIGNEIGAKLDMDTQVLLVASAADRAAFLFSPVDATTVLGNIQDYTGIANGIQCPAPPHAHPAVVPMVALLGAEALVSIAATATSMFQSQLLATGKASGVNDPTQLIIAGLVAGLADKSDFLHLHPPAITTSNRVLSALQALRVSLGKANIELAKCPQAANYAADTQKVKDANGYIASLVTPSGANPSLLDLAARRSAIDEAHIKYTLLMQRDVSGGGASAIKPNWFLSVKITMATADLITYQLVGFDGKVKMADYKWDHWSQTSGLNGWSNAFSDYRKP
jgi:hypothetical protein